MRAWAEAERAELRRARLRISLLVGVAISLMIAFVGGIAYVVMEQGQKSLVARELRYNAEFGVPGTAPRCAWVFTLRGGELDLGVLDVPHGFPLHDDLAAVRASGAPVERAVAANGTEYLVLTRSGRDGAAVQAVFDTRYQLADRRHLLQALGIAQLAGLVAAALVGLGVSRRTVAPLAEALARQRRFVTDASHELRTPIARAYTRAQVLVRLAAAHDLPDDHRDSLGKLAESIRGLGDVVDDLLLSARLRRELDGRPVDLAAVADAAVTGEGDRAAERRIRLAVDRPAEPVVVTGVETALRRAVDELLANAVRHTPEGGRIDVRVGSGAGYAVVEVADTGEGFAPADADRIFERFRHGAGEQRFGVGLALVREIVTSHGGAVEAAGNPGRGARFTLFLPMAGASPRSVPPRVATACP
ncbi:HAMP domain-containing sensor histidine kinase [Lentzea sp. NPDC042327]|uniref:sensor histidine kinase n=1 Tax=Lentzea sp. NPDC042327 TaxID=3154801 RepID=UPI0033D29124